MRAPLSRSRSFDQRRRPETLLTATMTAFCRPAGYLRGLTRKAEAGEFSLGPMLTA